MKEDNLTEYILCNSNYVTFFWKRQNCGDSKEFSGCQRFGERERLTGEAQGIFRAVKIFCMILYW